MAEERENDRLNETDKAGQQPTDQQRRDEFGQQQGQSSTGQTQPGGDAMTRDRSGGGQDTSGSGGSSQESFVGTEGGDSGDYLREDGSSSTKSESDFAKQGQGAKEDDSDIETGQPARAQDEESDIEGSGAA
jgi:hypothetical protein